DDFERILTMKENLAPMAASAVFGLILLFLGFEILTADKGKNQLFSMPDVNFLFASPTKPQTVLTFRTLMILGRYLFLAIYLGFWFGAQLPIAYMGIGILTLVLIFISVEVLSIFAYGTVNTHEKLKNLIKPVGYGLIALIPLICVLLYVTGSQDPVSLLQRFGNLAPLRLIPFIGWISGAVYHLIMGNTLAFFVYLVLCLAGVAVLIAVLYRVRFDFYESGLANAAKTQEMLDAQAQKRQYKKRKKDRSEKVHRDIITHGRGGSAFFFKAVALTHRNSVLKFLTPGSAVWLGVSLIVAFFTRVVAGSHTIVPLVGVYLFGLLIMFFGNPLAQEFEKNYIWLAPATNPEKLFYAFMGAEYGKMMNFLPAFLIGGILIGADPLVFVISVIMLISVSLFCSASGLLTGLIVPTSLPNAVQMMVQMLLKMLALMPTLVILLVFLILELLPIGCLLVIFLNLALALAAFVLSLIPMRNGKN
ncbi:MAG: putative ABC exporter domain-containing protein, partial [Eubacteriales bacterium]